MDSQISAKTQVDLTIYYPNQELITLKQCEMQQSSIIALLSTALLLSKGRLSYIWIKYDKRL